MELSVFFDAAMKSLGFLRLILKTRDRKVSRWPLMNTSQNGGPHRARRLFRGPQWKLGLTTSSWFLHRLPSIFMLPKLREETHIFEFTIVKFCLLWSINDDFLNTRGVLSNLATLHFKMFILVWAVVVKSPALSLTGLPVPSPTFCLSPVYWLDQADPTLTGWEPTTQMICSMSLAYPSPYLRFMGTNKENCLEI